VTARSLRVAPYVLVAILVAWTAWDVARVRTPRWDFSLSVFLLLAVVATVLGTRRWGGPLRSIGLFLLGLTYFAAHVVALGVDVVPALIFLTLAIVQVEAVSLAERFGPIYARTMAPEARKRINSALARTIARLGVAAFLAVIVPVVAADLALAGLVPATSIATAVVFAAGLVGVIALLALLPAMNRGEET